jgi:hypothetical protein
MHPEPEQDLLVPTERESFLSLLWDDVQACGVYADAAPSAAQRRQFIRAMFACIEGALWLFKEEALEQHKNGVIAFSISELTLLSEITPGIDNRGAVYDLPANLRFLPNLLFTFRCHARAFEYEPVLRVSDHEWADLQRSVKIRHRLMHPKKLRSMDVTDDELRLSRGALRWFGLVCSAATIGVSMWYARKSLDSIEDPTDRAMKLETISAAAEHLKRVVLES